MLGWYLVIIMIRGGVDHVEFFTREKCEIALVELKKTNFSDNSKNSAFCVEK